jgi:ATP-dependent DNA helicase PIF1
LGILSAIRGNAINGDHVSVIQKRKISASAIPEKAVKLYTRNINVDRTNDEMLATVVNRPVTFEMKTKGAPALVAALQKGCLSPEKLTLKVGAKVMFTKNNPKEGFVNGTLGTVEGFDTYIGLPIIRTNDGRKIMVEAMDWSVEENGKPRATITQVPLRLAWAITVHKSQGMSLEEAVMDLSDVFEFGQGYVALSRVRRLSGLHLLGWNEQAFQVHPEVLQKDTDFRINSEATELAFGNISKEELAIMHKNFIKACSGDEVSEKEKVASTDDQEIVYAPITGPDYVPGKRKNRTSTLKGKRYEKIREKHPNAFKTWSEQQDEELKEFFANGVPLEEIAETLGRKPGAVAMRLTKLGLMEDLD